MLGEANRQAYRTFVTAVRCVALGVCLMLCACGGRPAPVTAPVVSPLEVGAEPLIAEAVPSNALVVGRWTNASEWLDQMRPWAKSVGGVEALLRDQLALTTYPVDLEAPVEWLATLDESGPEAQLRWAVSLALRLSPEVALQRRGVESPIGLHCEQRAAVGPARGRVICAKTADELALLGPAMAKAVPVAPVASTNLAFRWVGALQPVAGSGRHSEQWVQRLASRLGLQTRNESISALLEQAARQIGEELDALRTDLVGAELTLVPLPAARSLAVTVSIPVRAPHSHWLRASIGNASAGLAPQDFWHLPVDAQAAGFHWSANLHALLEHRVAAAELLGRVLEFRGLPKRLQIQARQLLESLPVPAAPMAWARGSIGADGASPPWPLSLGWAVGTASGSFEEVRSFAHQLHQAYRDPVLGPQLVRVLRNVLGREAAPDKVTLRSLHGRFPPRSFALDWSFPYRSDGSGKRPVLSVHLAPLADGGYVVSWGVPAARLKRIVALVPSDQWSETLAGRAGLGRFNKKRVLRGEVGTVHRFAEGFAGLVARDGLSIPLRSEQFAPHRGRTPVLTDWTLLGASQSTAAGLVIQSTFNEPALRDLAFMLWLD